MVLFFYCAKVGKSFSNTPFHTEGLDDYGGDDEGDAEPEGPVELLQFAEDDGGEGDAVNRFQVIDQVHREGRDAPEGM